MSSNQQPVSYLAFCESHSSNNKIHSFKLRYSLKNNTHLKDVTASSSGGWWGITNIDIDTSKESFKTKVTWDDDTKNSYYSEKPKATAKPISLNLYDDIEYELVGRIKRPGQFELRQELLTTDQKCAISGERTLEVLEAAHLIDANKGGVCTPENSFLLRSDLHKLFDARLIAVDENGNVKLDDSVDSEKYRKELTNKAIDKKLFERISDALLERV